MFKLLFGVVLRLLGVVVMLCGATLMLWVGYNLFVVMEPEFVESTGGSARGGFRGLFFGLFLTVIGAALAFRKVEREDVQVFLGRTDGSSHIDSRAGETTAKPMRPI